MKYFFKHLHTVNVHRWEVFKLSLKVGIPFRGLVHDLSKYSFEEFFESVRYYKITKGNYSPLRASKEDNGYSKAWLHHKGRNKHHYEYWYDPAAPEPTPIIPFKYMLEMICDRVAASKTYNKGNYNDSDSLDYFYREKPHMTINKLLMDFLEEVFKKLAKNGEKILNKKYLYKLYLKHIKDN